MMKIVLFSGAGPISAAIRKFTRGKWAHAAIWDEGQGLIYEAREFRGVVATSADLRFAECRESEVKVAVFEIKPALTAWQVEKVRQFLKWELGKPYDYRGVLKFISRRNVKKGRESLRWFCSEFVAAAFAPILPLLNAPAWAISPEVLSYSTHLRRLNTF